MPPQTPADNLNQEQIKHLAGDTVYKRGKSIHKAGDVAIDICESKSNKLTIKARVQGQSLYRVELTFKPGKLESAFCGCPAFEYQELCKHCVATSLAADNPDVIPEAKSRKPSKADAGQNVLQDHFNNMDHADLVSVLMDMLKKDKASWKEWVIKAQVSGKSLDTKALKKMITQIFPKRQIWDYPKARQYFNQAEPLVDVFCKQLDSLSSESALALAASALERLETVLYGGIDDSGGFRGGVEARLCYAIVDAFTRLPWNEDQKARWLVEKLADYPDVFPRIPEDFNLSAAGEEAFMAACQQAFDAIEVPANISERKDNWSLTRLAYPLLHHAEKAQDFYQLLKLRSRLATTFSDMIRICELCLVFEDDLSAEDWLLKAKSLADTDRDKNACRDQQINIWLVQGEKKKAWQSGWQRYKESPGYKAYLKLEELAVQTGVKAAVYLGDVESSLLDLDSETTFGRIRRKSDAVLDFYLHRQEFEKAVQWASDHKAGSSTLLTLARQVAILYPQSCLSFYGRALDHILSQSNNRVYSDAVGHLLQLQKIWKGDKARLEDFAVLVRRLGAEYKRKRNFIGLLERHFPECLGGA